MRLAVGDVLVKRSSNKKGKVIEINNYWGWFVIRFENGQKKTYVNHMKDNSYFYTLVEKK